MILPSLEKEIASVKGIPEILRRDDEDPIQKLLEILDGCMTLGVEMEYFSMKLGNQLSESLPKMELVDAGELIGKPRLYKGHS